MKPRKRLPIRWLRLLMKRQGGLCAVSGCGAALKEKPRNFIDEHRIPLAIGGTNALKNRELRCIPCAREKTTGSSKATTYGSDVHAITKDRHIRTGKMKVNKRSKKKPTPKRAWPKRSFQRRTQPRFWNLVRGSHTCQGNSQ